MSALSELLDTYRRSSITPREQGDYFERLAKAYLENDSEQKLQYGRVWTYGEWAAEQGRDCRDTGIDLVASIRDEDGFCAIQCKFYADDYRIQKGDLDSFFTESGKRPFTRRLIIETTMQAWSEHAEAALRNQQIDTVRIGRRDMEKSDIKWRKYGRTQKAEREPQKELMEHQQQALAAVEAGLKEADRGKLIMACGTGKTFTSLKIAERLAGPGRRVLYLVPSLALMAQTVREWANDVDPAIGLRSFAVCSDTLVGKRRGKDDFADLTRHDLAFPATTKAAKLASKLAADKLADRTTATPNRGETPHHDAPAESTAESTNDSPDNALNTAPRESASDSPDNAHHHAPDTAPDASGDNAADNAPHGAPDASPRDAADNATRDAADKMTVVFATYQSIQVVSEAQKEHGAADFDLIICDEAHRTTGATLTGEKASNFVRVHDQDYIRGKKRLYMTATPRIFGDAVKAKADEADAELCSMDDDTRYGDTLHTVSFSEAVRRDLLTDYKVIVLAVDEEAVSRAVQERLRDGGSELKLDDATKIVGCYRALMKHGLEKDVAQDPAPMRRAVAFCQSISSSQLMQQEFAAVVRAYQHEAGQDDPPDQNDDGGPPAWGHTDPADRTGRIACEVAHVDGTFNARTRGQLLDWLNEGGDGDGDDAADPDTGDPDTADDNDDTDNPPVCRILSNARCLSEGVDVPALDAILFMHPRKSQLDVVQSVGRVMRRAPDKHMGYVILPVGIPAGTTPEEALNDNERYRVVWQTLNALRAHDDRFEAMINRIDLNEDVSDHLEIIGDYSDHGDHPETSETPDPLQMQLPFDALAKGIMAKIVKKCGTRDYWDTWAGDIADIAQTHITRIRGALAEPDTAERRAFDGFLAAIRHDLNDSISEGDAIEMLAQHIITRPVFEALFQDYSFAASNPVSKAMEAVLAVFQDHRLERESESLEKFYASVRSRVEGTETAAARQEIIRRLYDRFFKTAFPRLTEKLGIVYTPVEVVDFIIRSVNDILQQEFAQTLGSPGVHIIDPFTGTGTFIARLLQSGLIKPDELAHKYEHEIHASEIVLLAYYIAAINIEQAYHGLTEARPDADAAQGTDKTEAEKPDTDPSAATAAGEPDHGTYKPFPGICLADTFRLHESDDLVDSMLADNSRRRHKQKELDIRVIIGNPPWSAGQKSENDNAKNVEYPHLDDRIRTTYAAKSKAASKRKLYDSYIRAIRWGSHRLGGGGGCMAFVSGNGFIDKPAMDGMRQCLAEEFSSLYIFNLRGDIRKNMLSQGRAGEGGNVFGSASMTGTAITLFVKNPDAKEHGRIHYHDIGDELSQQEKLQTIKTFGSVSGLTEQAGWQDITPDKYNDWINQRDQRFDSFIAIGDKKDKSGPRVFANYSLGVATNRDAWCCNASKKTLAANMQSMISVYNDHVERYRDHGGGGKIEDFITTDKTKISWSVNLKKRAVRQKQLGFDGSCITKTIYRPFTKQWLYYSRQFNERVFQMPQIFPTGDEENRLIAVSGIGARSGFSVFMVSALPDLQCADNGQCFPLRLYAEISDDLHQMNLTEREQKSGQTASGQTASGYQVRDGITDAALAHFQAAYAGADAEITKDDLFYYIYGLLHSEDYRARFARNLAKQLPRIPAVKRLADFRAFAEAGRDLAELHVNYDIVRPHPVSYRQGGLLMDELGEADFRVEKMKFGKTPAGVKDKTTVIYNRHITMTDIPLEAYDYVVNGKPALEWVMERQGVRRDKDSGIVNDANDWAIETMNDAAYPLKLFQRVITVSLDTMKIVRALPKLDI